MNSNIIEDLKHMKETLWINDSMAEDIHEALNKCPLSLNDITDADARLRRFAPFLEAAFPETRKNSGMIESPLVRTDKIAELLGAQNVYMKLDSHLPVSGSIKARGGIYEVLKFTEDIALKNGILSVIDDYSVLLDDKYKQFFSSYSVAVGSTGNLGLSIGIMAAKIGFHVTVHMSSDARAWKKDMLRKCGCIVREYDDDYSFAVENGRREAEGNPRCHFVDDENSVTLFLGYATAALRLQKQLKEMNITVDDDHPVYIYLPCGVGGGPGGVAFGMKQLFGKNAHCFFAEPTHSPCMTLGMTSGKHSDISVKDIGLDNVTAADGLAVGRASGFVGKLMSPLIDGCFTVTDERMFYYLAMVADLENIRLEPSALAGMYGPCLMRNIKGATHIIWATGGGMVPDDIMQSYIDKGRRSHI